MPDFREYEDVIFIAGQNFQSEFGVHLAGSEVKEAAQFQNLQTLLDAKFIYPVAPEAGYSYLPPHLFNHIENKEEVMAKLAGAPAPNPDHFQNGKKPEAMLQAEREAELQYQAYASVHGPRDSKDNEKARKEILQNAQERVNDLATVDAQASYHDKGKDVEALYKDKKHVPELVEERREQLAKENAKADKVTDTYETLNPNYRSGLERDVPDEENPDKAASKTPTDETGELPADAVGPQPSNVNEGGQKPANRAQASKKKK